MISRRRALLTTAALLMTGPIPVARVAAGDRPVLLILGDSLSAEYGLRRNSGWVRLLGDRLAQIGAQYSVVNASISGETTSGGRTRLPALLSAHRPAIVAIQLGGNDGLRGLPLAAMRDNLRAMVGACKAINARVLMIGVRVPPNFGRDYAERFFSTFGDIARSEKTAHVPGLLDGFAENLEFFQPDRIHPAEAAQPLMLENVWPHLRSLLGLRSP